MDLVTYRDIKGKCDVSELRMLHVPELKCLLVTLETAVDKMVSPQGPVSSCSGGFSRITLLSSGDGVCAVAMKL